MLHQRAAAAASGTTEGRQEQVQRTRAIEIVASAKGSPIIFPMLIVRIAPVLRFDELSIAPFILRREGE